jgi:hypothetical protein
MDRHSAPLRCLAVAGLALSLLVGVSGQASARQDVATRRSPQFAKVWDRKDFSHRLLDIVLQRHVRRGRVDYPALRKSSLAVLDEYLFRIASTDPSKLSGGKLAQAAFWINAFNALVLRAVVANDAVLLGGKTPARLGAVKGFGDQLAYEVGGKFYTLAEVRRVLLTAPLRDVRYLFLLVTGARGDLPLADRSYTARSLPGQLTLAPRLYLGLGNLGFRFEAASKTLHLGEVFRLHAAEFERPPYGSAVDFVLAHVKERKLLEAITAVRAQLAVKYLSYDDTLNQP